METLTVNKLEENYGYVGCICGIYGVIFTFCLYRNLSGITFPICVAATIITSVLFLKRMGVTVRKNFMAYSIGMMLLGISTILTSNGFFHFFNWVGILLLLMTAMIQQLNDKNAWSFQKYILSILNLTGRIMISVCDPVIHAVRIKKRKEKQESKYFKPVILGIGIAILFLFAVLPLLIYSDKVFASIFGGFIGIFRFGNELGVFMTFLLGFVLIYAFFSALSGFRVKEQEGPPKAGMEPLTGITFTGILAAIYLMYSVIQVLFLFLRLDSGLPENVTYSEYAHSGFWQLLAVSLINFVTVLICISVFAENKILKTLLMIISGCTCVMAVSAAYRMVLYVNVYYLTFLRILVLWFLGVLLLIMGGVMWSIFRRNFRLFRYIMVVVTICYIGLSFANIDRNIAEYNIRNWETITSVDVYFLLYGTSIDAAPVIAENSTRIISDNRDGDKAARVNMVEEYFQNINEKEMTWRTWNHSLADAKKAEQTFYIKGK